MIHIYDPLWDAIRAAAWVADATRLGWRGVGELGLLLADMVDDPDATPLHWCPECAEPVLDAAHSLILWIAGWGDGLDDDSFGAPGLPCRRCAPRE
jgi:hypothetical protein